MILADLHNHTIAAHGQDTVADMYAAAQGRGLLWHGLSEHSPLPPGFVCAAYKGDLHVTFPAYVNQVLDLKRTVAENGGPAVLLGVELEWLPVNMPWMENLLARYPFDYVIGGLHFVNGVPVAAVRSWGEEVDLGQRFARYAAYYEEMARMAAAGLVDIVAHPDFVKTCCYADFQQWLARGESLDLIAAALEAIGKAGIAMEISSAGLRKPFKEPYPGPAIMRLAADLGLTVSFGSDAHSAGDAVSHFDQLADYARAYGFSRNRILEARQPLTLDF